MKELAKIDEKLLEKRIAKSKDVYRIAKKYVMPERLILEVAEQLSQKNYKGNKEDGFWWREVSRYQPLTEKFILECEDKVFWYFIFSYQKLSEQFILDNQKRSEIGGMWRAISRNPYVADDFIEKHKKSIRWNSLFEHTERTEQFIEKYADIGDWNKISMFQKLTEEFVLKHQDKIDFGSLSKNKHIAKDFFERNKEKITRKLYARELERIVKYQTVSEKTLKDIKKGKVVWKAISLHSDISMDFVIKNYDKINHCSLTRWNNKVSKEVKDEVSMIEKLSGNKLF